MHSEYFQWCKKAFENGWGTKEALRIWVAAEKITPVEYKEITGEDF